MIARREEETIKPDPMRFCSDLSIRHEWFVPTSMSHPAKLNLALLSWIIARYTRPGDTIGDPMIGIGSTLLAATLQRNIIGREIEPRWFAIARENSEKIQRQAGMFAGRVDLGQHDARQPWGYQVDHIVFSPPYGLSMASSPSAKGMLPQQVRNRLSKIPGHNKKLWDRVLSGQVLGAAAAFEMCYGQHPDQIGAYRGAKYWQAMTEIYTNARDALKGGYMVIVIKDHILAGQRVTVTDQTVQLCEEIGFTLVERHARLIYPMSLWTRRRKERGEIVVEDEAVLVFR